MLTGKQKELQHIIFFISMARDYDNNILFTLELFSLHVTSTVVILLQKRIYISMAVR